MNKIYVTEEQYKLLRDSFESVRGTSDYAKYYCESYCKLANKKNWFFTGYTCAAYVKGYFKTVRGETYIYSDVDFHGDFHGDFHRVRLNDECKKLLGIA